MKKIYLLPNFITMGNFLCGTYAIFFAIQGRPVLSIYMILAAMVFDFMDGVVARITRTQSRFGLQLDSLCDMVSFGVAPMVLVYTLLLGQVEKTVWFSGLIFTACGVLRLARYNVQAKSEEKNYFYGLPIPAAAGMVISYILLCLNHETRALLGMTPWIMVGTALLMVSNIKYPSFRNIDFKRRRPFESMILIVLISAFVSRYLYLILIWCFSGYTLIGIIFDIRERIHAAKRRAEEVILKNEKK